MGCCSNSLQMPNLESSLELLIKIIDEGRTKDLALFLRLISKKFQIESFINDELFESKYNILTNCVGHTVLYNKLETFTYFYKSFSISLQKLEMTFAEFGLSVISYFCMKGFTDFLAYYLSISSFFFSGYVLTSSKFSLMSKIAEKYINAEYTEVQLACLCDRLPCVRVIYNFFSNKITPQWLDINFQNANTGENCALLACKAGNFAMIKFLFVHCKANFHVLNNKNENALQVFLCASRADRIAQSFQIVQYLTEVVKVNIWHEMEESLLLCDFKEIAQYLERKFKEAGYSLEKKMIEEKYRLEDLKFDESFHSVGSNMLKSIDTIE